MNRQPKCKSCKERFEPFHNNSLQKFCMVKDDCIKAHVEYIKERKQMQDRKVWNKKKRDLRPVLYPKKVKNELQNEINKLARNIDTYFELPCIDCGKPYGNQSDGAHFHNVGGNENLRYNLHNVHKSRSDCNQYSSEHKSGYEKGILKRYGKEYLNYITTEIGKKYHYVGLKGVELTEKLAIVRKLNRDFDTFELLDPRQAREMFNQIIGIYK
jgi:hypothetical protein